MNKAEIQIVYREIISYLLNHKNNKVKNMLNIIYQHFFVNIVTHIKIYVLVFGRYMYLHMLKLYIEIVFVRHHYMNRVSQSFISVNKLKYLYKLWLFIKV